MFGILLIFIFIRPFIPSVTGFDFANFIYTSLLLGFLTAWVIVKGLSLEKIKIIRYPFILFIIALLVSLLFSYNRLASLKELYKYVTSILLFLTVLSLSDKQRTLIIKCITLAGVLISLMAIYQYFFGFRHIVEYISKKNITDPFILDYVGRKRVFLPFVTPNILGGYLAMIILLTLIHKHRIWLIVPLASALLFTQSVGALLSLFLGLAMYFYLQANLSKRKFLFLFALLIIIISVVATRSANQKQHIQPIFSTMMRLNYWQDTLKIIKMHPLTGLGLGNFNLIYSRYSHNSYLQIWAEMGILGIISLLWLIATVFKYALNNIKYSDRNHIIFTLISANSIFLMHNFMDFTFFLPEVAFAWWVILGLTLPKE